MKEVFIISKLLEFGSYLEAVIGVAHRDDAYYSHVRAPLSLSGTYCLPCFLYFQHKFQVGGTNFLRELPGVGDRLRHVAQSRPEFCPALPSWVWER
jgi:hypothetical protein